MAGTGEPLYPQQQPFQEVAQHLGSRRRSGMLMDATSDLEDVPLISKGYAVQCETQPFQDQWRTC
jgi:hypothetical protein